MLGLDQVLGMKVESLKIELKKRGFLVRGNKKEWIDWLKATAEGGATLVDNMSKNKDKNLAGDSFSLGAQLEMLDCTGDFIKITLY